MLNTIAGVCLAILLILLLSACQSVAQVPVVDRDPAAWRIAEAAQRIRQHNTELAAIEAANYQHTTGKTLPTIDMAYFPALNKRVSLGAHWAGPLDSFIIRLSAIAGLNPPRFMGVKPAGDVIISLPTHQRPVIDLFQDAGTQAGSRAHVTLKMSARFILVEYVPY
jgi:hypothetical protein